MYFVSHVHQSSNSSKGGLVLGPQTAHAPSNPSSVDTANSLFGITNSVIPNNQFGDPEYSVIPNITNSVIPNSVIPNSLFGITNSVSQGSRPIKS